LGKGLLASYETLIEGFENGPEENILSQKGGSGRRLEKTA
jgi:hypothetical protein